MLNRVLNSKLIQTGPDRSGMGPGPGPEWLDPTGSGPVRNDPDGSGPVRNGSSKIIFIQYLSVCTV